MCTKCKPARAMGNMSDKCNILKLEFRTLKVLRFPAAATTSGRHTSSRNFTRMQARGALRTACTSSSSSFVCGVLSYTHRLSTSAPDERTQHEPAGQNIIRNYTTTSTHPSRRQSKSQPPTRFKRCAAHTHTHARIPIKP